MHQIFPFQSLTTQRLPWQPSSCSTPYFQVFLISISSILAGSSKLGEQCPWQNDTESYEQPGCLSWVSFNFAMIPGLDTFFYNCIIRVNKSLILIFFSSKFPFIFQSESETQSTKEKVQIQLKGKAPVLHPLLTEKRKCSLVLKS